MKLYSLLTKHDDPCKYYQIYAKGAKFLYSGIANNIPWYIAKRIIYSHWEDESGCTWVLLKGEEK